MKRPKLIKFGHETLRRVAIPLSTQEITSPETQQLVNNLRAAIGDHGIGVAAPQIDVSKRVFLADISKENWSKDDVEVTVILNPEIINVSDKCEYDWEGCLSAPGIWGKVKRPYQIEVTYLDEQGSLVNKVLIGLAARVFQHELDHLNGILFVDRMDDMSTLMMDEEFRKIDARRDE